MLDVACSNAAFEVVGWWDPHMGLGDECMGAVLLKDLSGLLV